MDQPSKQLADRYRLQLTEPWQAWFDRHVHELQPAGVFQVLLPAERLLGDCPSEIWPGFMLPDTLPLVGNEYGDWICARVTPEGELGELLHWYHGGGDWVPVGNRLAEALVHDVVDQFRPVGRQMLRGATETLAPHHRSRVLAAFEAPAFRQWLSTSLATPDDSPAEVAQALDHLAATLQAGDYSAALRLLYDRQWSPDAVACDLIEDVLQRPLAKLADPAIAKSLELNWTPDYVRWLFDAESTPQELRPQILELAGMPDAPWPQQDWAEAQRLAQSVLERRHDLGWAYDIVGWSQRRQGNVAEAANIYFAGRHTAAFSDQAVRMRTHWIESRFGKFAIAQLVSLADQLTATQREDRYLATIWQAPEKLMLSSVQAFWCTAGREQQAQGAHGEAYASYLRAGWDLGVQRLSEYQRIFEALIDSAHAAGWPAPGVVAETHLACLRARYV